MRQLDIERTATIAIEIYGDARQARLASALHGVGVFIKEDLAADFRGRSEDRPSAPAAGTGNKGGHDGVVLLIEGEALEIGHRVGYGLKVRYDRVGQGLSEFFPMSASIDRVIDAAIGTDVKCWDGVLPTDRD